MIPAVFGDPTLVGNWHIHEEFGDQRDFCIERLRTLKLIKKFYIETKF
jgi:hypothetical protein